VEGFFPTALAKIDVRWQTACMNRFLPNIAASAFALALPAFAQDEPESAPSPNQIVEMADPEEWAEIAAENLLVMTLAPDREGNPRKVVIQLMPEPFSQGWVENIRTLARANWYDGISVNRVQDNYVVQWGDPNYDNPESGETEPKPLPEGLKVMGEDEYSVTSGTSQYATLRNTMLADFIRMLPADHQDVLIDEQGQVDASQLDQFAPLFRVDDSYSDGAYWTSGWPVSFKDDSVSPTHCYGMVGVGRNYSPDTGSGAELYTVIGHAPRHLDRNIALVGRVIEGMEHLSSLPRGSGTLGFYTEEEADKRTPIRSIRVAAELPEGKQPAYEYLSTESETFARYAEARANRRDPFFIVPAGGADICNIPVPIRAVEPGPAD